MSIQSSTRVSRVPGVLATRVADQVVLLNDELRYVGLDRTGQAVWDLLQEDHTVDELVDGLVARFDVPPDRCRDDLIDFLGELGRYRVVELG